MSTQRVRVRRRLLHWRPRWRQVDGGFDIWDGIDDLFIGLLVGLAFSLALVLLLPVVVLAVEVLIVLLIAGLGMLGRVLFGQPWTVEAVDTASSRVLVEWRVRGFRTAGRVAAAIQAGVDVGAPLPTAHDDVLALLPERPRLPSWPAR